MDPGTGYPRFLVQGTTLGSWYRVPLDPGTGYPGWILVQGTTSDGWMDGSWYRVPHRILVQGTPSDPGTGYHPRILVPPSDPGTSVPGTGYHPRILVQGTFLIPRALVPRALALVQGTSSRGTSSRVLHGCTSSRVHLRVLVQGTSLRSAIAPPHARIFALRSAIAPPHARIFAPLGWRILVQGTFLIPDIR